MEIRKYIMAILVIYIGTGCLATRQNVKIKKQQMHSGTIHEIKDIISRTDKLIMNKVSRNGIDSENIKLIHDITVQFDSCYDKNRDSLKVNHIVNSLEKVNIHSNWITAFIVSNDNYIAKSSTSTFIKRPEVYTDYKIEKELIKVNKSNNYIAFLTFLGCYPDYYLGFKEEKIDIFKKLDNNQVIFLKSMPNPIHNIH